MPPRKTPPRTPAVYALMLEIARYHIELPALEQALKQAESNAQAAQTRRYNASSAVDEQKRRIETRLEALKVLLQREPLNPDAQSRMLRDALAEAQAAKA